MEKVVNEKNIELWSGISETYNNSRPVPPEVIIKTVLSWLKNEPNFVVDVGCGTGLSTIIWKDIATKIIGIDPNDDMRATAEKNTYSDNIIFKKGVSNETNLPSEYADIITVSQAFHWMDIDSTLIEFYRVLQDGGVLAIYDYDWPPVIDWEIEKEYQELAAKCVQIIYSLENPPVANYRSTYYDRIKSFGKFRYLRETVCHSVEKYTPKKFDSFHLRGE